MVVAAMRIVPVVHLAEAVVLMVLPVPMAVAQAEPDRAQLQGSLARLPGNCIPAAAAVALHTTTDIMQTPEPVAQAAAAMVQNSVVLLGTELLILVEAEAVVLITPILPATVPRAEAAARASSVCAYTKNKHDLHFGGRDKETEVYMSNIVGKPLMACGGIGGGTYFEFTYTGASNYRQEDDVLELLSSGTLTVLRQFDADVFLVGGGGSGGYGNNTSTGTGGGGGGYTKTIKVTLRPATSYEVLIGDGAAPSGRTGGTTSAFGSSVNGGGGGVNYSNSGTPNGGSGGSGGGAGVRSGSSSTGNGGTDGGNGSTSEIGAGGSGQGTTTREFGEVTGKLYAGGGGGGVGYATIGGAGGAGGGGAGGASSRPGNNATPNTGGGGGGGGNAPGSTSTRNGGSGGSGIVCIRVHRKN